MPIRPSSPTATAVATLALWSLAGCATAPSASRLASPTASTTAAPAAAATAATSPAPDAAPKKGYLLFRSVFPDPTALRAYGRAVLPLVATFGGRFLVTADAPAAVEGSPDTRRVVIVEFPSLAAAQAFWHSEDYAAVKQLRAGLGEVDAVLFEGR